MSPSPLYGRELDETDYQSYVSASERFDVANARFFELVLGVATTGTAPADDVVVESLLPGGVEYHEDPPRLPTRPRRQDLFGVHIPQHPVHVERTVSFDFEKQVQREPAT